MRCFVLVGVDACIVDSDAGVGCGVLTDEALTELLELEGDCKYETPPGHKRTWKKELGNHEVCKFFESTHHNASCSGLPRTEILKV